MLTVHYGIFRQTVDAVYDTLMKLLRKILRKIDTDGGHVTLSGDLVKADDYCLL